MVSVVAKCIASCAVCAMGCFAVWWTDGRTSSAWAALAIFFIWNRIDD